VGRESAHPLAVTMGDPAGIGPDITLMAWQVKTARGLPVFAVYADAGVLQDRARALGIDCPIEIIARPADARDVFSTALPVLHRSVDAAVVAGQPSTTAAAATVRSIDAAVDAVLANTARAVVTNPIAKSVLYAAGFTHPGHTEYLAHLARERVVGCQVVPVMMLACDELRVVPVTIHVPLAAVPGLLTRDLLMGTLRTTHAALIADFGIANPRIAVAGLNPHAGESGTIGTEDRDVIAPVITHLAASGMAITGPHPADTLFHGAARTRYDGVVAMYHDQALIPIKTLAFDRGVNVTLGLPFVRTSPDHGTAFDIAGSGSANPESLIQALLMADRMATARANRRSGAVS
jgi:4-hydroxythreonine-4-phosphate dehydrogenase